MERGAQLLVRMLLAALLLGVLVLAIHPDYRATMKALWNGRPAVAPVWQSNANYYTEVGLAPRTRDVHAK